MLVQWWHHFSYASTPKRGNWFQTNQPEHELDYRVGDTVTSVCVTNKKDTALQQEIWSTFVTLFWCSKTFKTKITDGTRILVPVRVLWDMISKIYWQFWHSFFKNALESSYNFNPITWRKMVRSVCFKPVSMAMWRLYTLWCFTVPVYIRGDISVYQQSLVGLLICLSEPLHYPMAFSNYMKCEGVSKARVLNKPWCACTPPGKEQKKLP